MRTRDIIFAAILLLFGLSITEQSFAQNPEPKHPHNLYIYGEIGGGYGTHESFKSAIDVITNHTILTVCYTYSSRRADNVPSDYHSGLFDQAPTQSQSTVGLMYGSVIYSKQHLTRFTLKGGLGLDMVNTPRDFVHSGGLFNSNYQYSYGKDVALCMLLNPTLELPIGRGFGFSVGGYANINFLSPVFGLEGSMLFGKLFSRH